MKKGFLLFCMTLLLSMLYSSMVYAQDRTISGTVTDARGETLPGVTVMVRGTTIGTVTDIDGGFGLNVPVTADFLVFTFVGMRRVEIPLSAETTYRVTMEPEAYGLDEVVVVGYGSQVRANLTGAVDMVTSERFENRPITSVGEGLQGLIPNLNVTVYSGDPTRSTDLNVRGFESITGGEPLVLVDGVPMDLNRVNPSDIESITVLKDAAAGAIYGARAAFGVIMVETKRGTTDGMNVRFSAEHAFDVPIFHMEPITNGYEFALLRNQVEEREGQQPVYSPDYMERLKRYWDDPDNNPPYEIYEGSFNNYAATNLQDDVLMSVSPQQKYDLSINGVTDRARYYSSFGYLNTDGWLDIPDKNHNFKRYNVLMKGDLDITDWLNIDQQITLNSQVSDKPYNDQTWTIFRIEPIRSYRVPYLEEYPELEGEYWDQPHALPAWVEKGGRDKWQNTDTWLKTGITINPINRVRIRSDFSYNMFKREAEAADPQYQLLSGNFEDGPQFNTHGDNIVDVRRDYHQYYVFNMFGEYEIADYNRHYVKAMVGFNQEWGRRTHISGRAYEPVSSTVVDIGATTGIQSITGGKDHVALRGAFYRLNYIYDGKYLFEANGRYDGTSRFGTDDRFGFFPSFSAAWRISAESFMFGVSHIFDDIKIRASYGTLGNQLLGNRFYPYIASMNVTETPIPLSSGRIPVVRMPGLISPDLTWESVVSQNLGLDLTLLDYRLNATFDMYTRETKDMLMRKSYPTILGAAAPDENAADLMTKGWELSIRWRDRVTSDFNYDFSFVLSDWVSEITKYDNPTGSLNDYYVGQILGEIWGYETVGIFQTNEEVDEAPSQGQLGVGWRAGDIRFADLNDDGEITAGNNTLDDPGDRRIIGNENPRYSFGMNAGMNYKNFGLSLFFQGVGKRDYSPGSANWTWFYPWRAYAADKAWVRDSWTPDNRDAYFPEMQTGDKNWHTQTRFLQNAAYVRLKSLTLSYNLPHSITSRIGMNGVRIYASGQNLWEYSQIRKPLDPEYIFNQRMDFPLMRTYSFGIIVNI